jgi:hypothetical protein
LAIEKLLVLGGISLEEYTDAEEESKQSPSTSKKGFAVTEIKFTNASQAPKSDEI